jgi:prepilin signal peptidase PulO-like enzyme (type II secretory pathway)
MLVQLGLFIIGLVGLLLNSLQDLKFQTVRISIVLFSAFAAILLMLVAVLLDVPNITSLIILNLQSRLFSIVVSGLILSLFWFFSAGKFGFGDVIVLTSNAFYLDWYYWLIHAILATIFGILFILIRNLFSKTKKIEKIPFVPFICFGYTVAGLIMHSDLIIRPAGV